MINVYSDEFETEARLMIRESSLKHRITVHETRNFIDYDLVPFVKKLLEREK